MTNKVANGQKDDENAPSAGTKRIGRIGKCHYVVYRAPTTIQESESATFFLKSVEVLSYNERKQLLYRALGPS